KCLNSAKRSGGRQLMPWQQNKRLRAFHHGLTKRAGVSPPLFVALLKRTSWIAPNLNTSWLLEQ
ncbi:MAG: hypothetical protein J0665_02070, partial [Deltaproteobacteria bacterium]|nr:hypothetical protein [Deltaproteobacteria bacterium]